MPSTTLDTGALNTSPVGGSIPLATLLSDPSLRLEILASAPSEHDDRVRWVHASELEDPTPFLPSHTVLLTTGARFRSVRSRAHAERYVSRLLEAGTTALGFAIGLHWDAVPAHLVAACQNLGLTLFVVPYETAFITIVQAVATRLNEQLRDRNRWALESQRAVLAASLRRNGLSAALRETAACLHRWVCITDRSGSVLEAAPAEALGESLADRVKDEVRRLIHRKLGASRVLSSDEGEGIRLQALGSAEQPVGVLVVADRGAPDTAERSLLGLLAALATSRLERSSGTDDAQSAVRSALFELLLEQRLDAAQRVAAAAGEAMPAGQVVLVRFRDPEQHAAEVDLDIRSLDIASRQLFRARVAGSPVLVTTPHQLGQVKRVLAAHGVAAGVSGRGDLGDIPTLLVQANRALEHAHAANTHGPVDYAPAEHGGLLNLLAEQDEALERALALLAPIRRHDERHGDKLEHSLRVWLSHHGQTTPAAAELGVHRHTLRARVQTAASLLQCDIDSPGTRAEIWTALSLAHEA